MTTTRTIIPRLAGLALAAATLCLVAPLQAQSGSMPRDTVRDSLGVKSGTPAARRVPAPRVRSAEEVHRANTHVGTPTGVGQSADGKGLHSATSTTTNPGGTVSDTSKKPGTGMTAKQRAAMRRRAARRRAAADSMHRMAHDSAMTGH